MVIAVTLNESTPPCPRVVCVCVCVCVCYMRAFMRDEDARVAMAKARSSNEFGCGVEWSAVGVHVYPCVRRL